MSLLIIEILILSTILEQNTLGFCCVEGLGCIRQEHILAIKQTCFALRRKIYVNLISSNSITNIQFWLHKEVFAFILCFPQNFVEVTPLL